MYCCLPTKLQRKLSNMLKVTYIIMIMYYVTPMIPLFKGFYLFPLSHAVNSNGLIFDPSEVKIDLYIQSCSLYTLNIQSLTIGNMISFIFFAKCVTL